MKLRSWLGLILAQACSGPAVPKAPPPAAAPSSAIQLTGLGLSIGEQRVPLEHVNQHWISPSRRWVAYSRVFSTRPSERGGELMPFYAVGVVDVASRAVVLELEPEGQGSVLGRDWSDERFRASFSTGGVELELAFDPAARRIVANRP